MKRIAFLLGIIPILLVAQPATPNKTINTGGTLKYESVPGDPMKTRIYTLSNGLKVFLTVNTAEPSIMTYIAVKAGSKNDPSEATGLAHYLEHMLFKGTDQYGTKDYSQEAKQLAVIESLYETYHETQQPEERKHIYHQIDSVSALAAKLAIANEYDKMVSAIGAKMTNAYTSFEQTVYMNSIPANQLSAWLKIEAERFRKPVMRLFHTELEAVYEEKNISLDDDANKVYEALLGALFQQHAYGTQTTIGTVEHLKNPSLKRIQEYLEKYYVPGNMAVCLSGDLAPDSTIRMIEETLGRLPSKPLPPAYTFQPEKNITEPVTLKVVGADAEFLTLGYRLPSVHHADYPALYMIDALLSNQSAGLIDLNLVNQQKLLEASSYLYGLADYGAEIFEAKPREGQTLEEVKNLVLAEIQKLKEGKFEDKQMTAVLNNYKIDQIKMMENNSARAHQFVEIFTSNQTWADYVNFEKKLSLLKKEDIIRVANKYYGKNYVAIYKEVGKDTAIVKVEKPEITPVEVNRDDKSGFHEQMQNERAGIISPVFLDYSRDIEETQVGPYTLEYLKNQENDLFHLTYLFDIGKAQQPRMALAVEYLKYLGTPQASNEAINKAFYALGCEYGVMAGEEEMYVYLKGLQSSFKEGLLLLETLLNQAVPDSVAYQNMVEGIMKQREDQKQDKRTIMFEALKNYGLYGDRNPFTQILLEPELRQIQPAQLTQMLRDLTSMEHRVLYYGPLSKDLLTADLKTYHKVPQTLRPIPPTTSFDVQDPGRNHVLFVDFDMVQAELLWLGKSNEIYSAEMTPIIQLYNEYFGGGMGSVVFQTIRESKALAYSTFAAFQTPARKDKNYWSLAYVGTQADKLPEALPAMNELLTELPVSEVLFKSAQDALINRIAAERIIRNQVLLNHAAARRRGVERDVRRLVYEQVGGMTTRELTQFHQQAFGKRPRVLLVLGSREKIDFKALEKFGPVTELTLENIFGY